jgi:hypothetical protein
MITLYQVCLYAVAVYVPYHIAGRTTTIKKQHVYNRKNYDITVTASALESVYLATQQYVICHVCVDLCNLIDRISRS